MSFRQSIIKSAKQMTATKSENIKLQDLSEIQNKTPDNTGWLTIDDTVIDFSLMQGEDNLEYLSKDNFYNQSVK